MKIVEKVHKELRRRKERLALAESCTGGAIAAALTEIPGASEVLWGSAVVYSAEAKCALLGLSRELIELEGAVSLKVTKEMARGALEISGSTWAVAVTGYVDKELVFGVIAHKGGEVKEYKIPLERALSRSEVIACARDFLLERLFEAMEKKNL